MPDNVNVTVGQGSLSVYNSPNAIDLTVDVGASGTPGSQIYVVNVTDPNDETQLTYTDGYPYIGGKKVNIGDILINYNSQGYPKFHQYTSNGSTRTFSTLFTMENFITAAAFPSVLDALSFDELATFIDHSEHVNITSFADYPNSKIILTAALDDANILEQLQDFVSQMLIYTNSDAFGIIPSYDDDLGLVKLEVDVPFIQNLAGLVVSGGTHTNIQAEYDDVQKVVNLSISDNIIQDKSSAILNHSDHINITATYDTNTNKIILTGKSQEEIQDLVAPLLNHSNHTGISVSYDDDNNKIILTASNDEAIQDLVAEMFNGTQNDITVSYDDTTGKITLTAGFNQESITSLINQTVVAGANISINIDPESSASIINFAPNIAPQSTLKTVSTGSINGSVIISTISLETDGISEIQLNATVPYMLSTASADKYRLFLSESTSETTVGTMLTSVTGAHQTGNSLSYSFVPDAGTKFYHLCALKASGTGTFTAYADSGTTYGAVTLSGKQVY